MKHLVFTFLATLIFLSESTGQDFVPYHWEDDRTLSDASGKENIPLYYIKLHKQFDYRYDPSGELMCYQTTHQIIRTQNDDAVASNNRIYISGGAGSEIIAIRSRIFTPDGTIKEFDENNIQEIEDEETGSGYRIFAIEGAVVGGEIEYYYVQKVPAGYFGREFFQFGHPVDNYSFALSSPENLEFDFRIYNNEGKVAQTDTVDTINSYQFSLKNVAPLYGEAFSAYDANRNRIEYKLAYNSAKGKGRLFTWGEAGIRIYDQQYSLTKNESKALKKFLSKNLQPSLTGFAALAQLEHLVKTRFFIDENASGMADQIDFVLANHYGSARGLSKLYVALVTELGIPDMELVLATDRGDIKFDGGFDTWKYLDKYLLYFPRQNAYLAPDHMELRLGPPPSELSAGYGLFIRPEKIQGFTHPISRIDYIQETSYTNSSDDLDIVLRFSEDLSATNVQVTRSFLGYNGFYYKAALTMYDEDQKKDILDDIIKYLAPDADIHTIEIREMNATPDTWNQPLKVYGEFTSTGYLEQAGNTILLKVGELIGPQSELYQEEERKTPVENSNNRGYIRKIKIEIPEGYSVQNPDDLILNESVYEGDDLIFTYNANYTREGNLLTIDIREFYERIYYPLDDFEAFRKVVNAAADWNKIILVLKPD
ncbi:MAG: DUF3857 domain-containing protein [Cyclobacteriaceae bacterium]|nr:DUF3857 domain-containing protein [Cyclobacteriaceae bacterium]